MTPPSASPPPDDGLSKKSPPDPTPLGGGFAHAAHDAAHAFRAAMTAMARPGERHAIAGARPPGPASSAAGALALTLCDPDTRLHLAGRFDTPELRDWIRFHTAAVLSPAETADFALGAWADLAPLPRYAIGTPEYPDRSATLIIELTRWPPPNVVLRGPGLREPRRAHLPDPTAFAVNHARYPLGLDFFFTCGDALTALPRSTHVTPLEG